MLCTQCRAHSPVYPSFRPRLISKSSFSDNAVEPSFSLRISPTHPFFFVVGVLSSVTSNPLCLLKRGPHIVVAGTCKSAEDLAAYSRKLSGRALSRCPSNDYCSWLSGRTHLFRLLGPAEENLPILETLEEQKTRAMTMTNDTRARCYALNT